MPLFKLEIRTDNAAFEDNPVAEIARILRVTAERVIDPPYTSADWHSVYDVNGNPVGCWGIVDR